MTDAKIAEPVKGPGLKTVVAASAAGTAFEWYDFFIFGSLAAILAQNFFSGVNETAAFIFALGTFAVGFFARPFGALVFGHFGDRNGRKNTFLVTITLMGMATILIGVLPTYEQAGIIAPILLIVLRVLQGFALGGEYGGAAIYVAEHAPDDRRGGLTGWIQTSAAFGLIGALAVILATRTVMGEEAFADWGWRIPFLLSLGLLVISLWIRLKLNESPAFQQMKAEGTESRAPLKEAFGRWSNLKWVIVALLGIMMAQGVVWYTAFFYSQFFMERVLKVAPATVNELLIWATFVSAVLYVAFARLSDFVGRKPVMIFGMVLAAVSFFPAFHLMTHAANPALAQAVERAPVVVVADPQTCSLQFDPVGKTAFTSACDVAKNVLARSGTPYDNVAAPAGSPAVVRVGAVEVVSADVGGLPPAEADAMRKDVQGRIAAALKAAGYPAAADPAQVNKPLLLGILLIFVVAATALYGPQAAALVELFPTNVRYSAMSLPYHVGTGWFGGFLPATAFAMVAATGDIYFGLWYPVVVAAAAAVIALIFLPETKGRDLNQVGR